MAYTGSGRLPMERASKIGHVKVIADPHIQRLVAAFEQTSGAANSPFGELSGHIDLEAAPHLENVVAVDGSHAAIPNAVRNNRRLAFIKVSAIILTQSQMTEMRRRRINDARDLSEQLDQQSASMCAALPLSGVSIAGETVAESIRKIVDSTLHNCRLYETLRFLVSREWLPNYEMHEHMACYNCGREVMLPRSTLQFRCVHCAHPHTWADYLEVNQRAPEDWAREEAAINLRNVMETLTLFSFIRQYADRPVVLQRTLFLKDGPLLLRAQLSRLVEPIRAFLTHLQDSGRSVHLIGIEKTGDLVEHTSCIGEVLAAPGDYFLPSVRYLHERIQGVPFDATTYWNRAQYGAKVVVRLGANHVIAADVPTGDFLLEPSLDDLYGFSASMALLADMLSYRYENALVPLVLANSVASISTRPSGDILEAFARTLLGR